MELSSSKQGDIGELEAMAYFSKLGYDILIPFTKLRYDLVVSPNDSDDFLKVQCKTTGSIRNNTFVVSLGTNGGNQSWNGKRKLISKEDCDLLFVWSLDDSSWVFPVEVVEGKTCLTLGNKYENYKIK